MTSDDYRRAVEALDDRLAEYVRGQVFDEERPDDGGYVSTQYGFASAAAGDTPTLAALLGLGVLTPESRFFEDAECLERFERAASFLRRCQRPSGCVDLPSCNYDSPPDTAFSVARVAPVARIARDRSDVDAAEEVAAALEPFLVDAARGIADGGFHTANHRWVIVDALARVHELYPDESFVERIEAYLAEGIDVNDDGEYSERSHAIYTHVVNTHLVGAAEALDRPELLDPVRRSLHAVMDYLDDDWSVVTDLSSRQDRGRDAVPTRGAATFYFAARRFDDERLAAGARALLERGGWDDPGVVTALHSHFHRHPSWRETDLPEGEREPSLSRRMTDSGVWRLRDGRWSATVATGTPNAVSCAFGDVSLDGLRVTSPYFGGEFLADGIEFHDDGATVSVEPQYWHDDLPGYWHPLGRPVDWGELDREDRTVDELPDVDVSLDVERVERGLDVTVRAAGGPSRVPFAVESRFAPGGRLDLPSGSVTPAAGDPVHLDAGYATYRDGDDAIRIGPGAGGHRIAPGGGADAVRLVVATWAPFERTVEIRGGDRLSLVDRPPAGPAGAFDGPE